MYQLTGVCLNNFYTYHEELKALAVKYEPITIPLDEEQSIELLISKYNRNRNYSFFNIAMCFVFFAYFFWVEGTEFYRNGTNYFNDIWNMNDFTSFTLNYAFLCTFLCNLYFDECYYSQNLCARFGSFAMFVMWIKVFYWFRLFTSYAYYVRLIV